MNESTATFESYARLGCLDEWMESLEKRCYQIQNISWLLQDGRTRGLFCELARWSSHQWLVFCLDFLANPKCPLWHLEVRNQDAADVYLLSLAQALELRPSGLRVLKLDVVSEIFPTRLWDAVARCSDLETLHVKCDKSYALKVVRALASGKSRIRRLKMPRAPVSLHCRSFWNGCARLPSLETLVIWKVNRSNEHRAVKNGSQGNQKYLVVETARERVFFRFPRRRQTGIELMHLEGQPFPSEMLWEAPPPCEQVDEQFLGLTTPQILRTPGIKKLRIEAWTDAAFLEICSVMSTDRGTLRRASVRTDVRLALPPDIFARKRFRLKVKFVLSTSKDVEGRLLELLRSPADPLFGLDRLWIGANSNDCPCESMSCDRIAEAVATNEWLRNLGIERHVEDTFVKAGAIPTLIRNRGLRTLAVYHVRNLMPSDGVEESLASLVLLRTWWASQVDIAEAFRRFPKLEAVEAKCTPWSSKRVVLRPRETLSSLGWFAKKGGETLLARALQATSSDILARPQTVPPELIALASKLAKPSAPDAMAV